MGVGDGGVIDNSKLEQPSKMLPYFTVSNVNYIRVCHRIDLDMLAPVAERFI